VGPWLRLVNLRRKNGQDREQSCKPQKPHRSAFHADKKRVEVSNRQDLLRWMEYAHFFLAIYTLYAAEAAASSSSKQQQAGASSSKQQSSALAAAGVTVSNNQSLQSANQYFISKNIFFKVILVHDVNSRPLGVGCRPHRALLEGKLGNILPMPMTTKQADRHRRQCIAVTDM
jgi:hypothetical protein